jgi:hypothetical protein
VRPQDETIGGARRSPHGFIKPGGDIVRTLLPALAIASAIGFAAPALADYGPPGSAQRAILAANAYGVVGINEIQFFDGKWEVEGRDPAGRGMTVYVDAFTGAVTNVQHY